MTSYRSASISENIRFNVAPLQRGLLLVFITILCYIVSAVISAIILHKGLTGTRVCLTTITQDIIVFILPALATAMFITRRFSLNQTHSGGCDSRFGLSGSCSGYPVHESRDKLERQHGLS